jgi:hypothetical protein
MSIVRSMIISAILAATSLAASAQAAAPFHGHSPPARTASQAETTKHVACEKVWAAQRVRHGTRQAFVAACVAKG